MNSNDLLDMIGDAKGTYVWDAQLVRNGNIVQVKNHSSSKQIWLIAALIAMMLFLMGCTALILMQISDLSLREETYEAPAYYLENGEKAPEEERVRSEISLQGIQGSAAYNAAQEWLEFAHSYDQDMALLSKAAVNNYEAPREYDAYFVYNQEMIDKVDEIAAKYNLQLAGPRVTTQQYMYEVFCDSLGIDGVLKRDAHADVTYYDGDFFACGNFAIGYECTLTAEESTWSHLVCGTYTYRDKNYFTTAFVTFHDTSNLEQWNYTLADGTKVLIINTGERAWVFHDREDAFIFVTFSTVYENGITETMTNREIELASEVFDFSLKPQKPDIEQADLQIQKAEMTYQAQQEALQQESLEQPQKEPVIHHSYAELIAYIPAHESEFEWLVGDRFKDFLDNCDYVLMDLTGDGEDELILGRDGHGVAIYYVVDGEVIGESCSGEIYICEGGIQEQYIFKNGEPQHYYSKIGAAIEGREVSNDIAYVAYSTYYKSWMYLDFTADIKDESAHPITEDEAMEIINSFVRIKLNWKPVSEFTFK